MKNPTITKSRLRVCRPKTGFSIVLVMIIGLVGLLIVAALFGTLSPVLGFVRNGKLKTALRSASEATLDWACDQLSTGQGGIDDSSNDGAPAGPFTVSSQVVGNFGYPITSTVTVNNLAPPQTSYLYDSTIDSTIQANGIPSNGWRVLTATASYAGKTETIRAVLRPAYTVTNSNWNFGAMYAKGSFTATGNQIVNSFDSGSATPNAFGTDKTMGQGNSKADVDVNGNTSLSGNVELGGGLLYAGNYSSSGNSTVDGQKSHGTPPAPPPVPPAPANAQLLAPISLSGQGQTTISSGDYYIQGSGNGISLSGQAKININIVGNQPVRIWVTGSNPSISISGQGFSNGTGVPANLQIYFSGTSQVKLSGNADMYGVVYAPSADISLSGNGQIYGAVVGNNITMNGGGNSGGFHYDRALGRTAFPISAAGPPQYLRAVSWQEL